MIRKIILLKRFNRDCIGGFGEGGSYRKGDRERARDRHIDRQISRDRLICLCCARV